MCSGYYCHAFLTKHHQDSALMRPGRLDRILYVGPPDRDGREEILKIRTRKMSVGSDLDLHAIAAMVSTVLLYLSRVSRCVQTDGCSGAEISSLCQEAALLTMQKDINASFVSFSISLFWRTSSELSADPPKRLCRSRRCHTKANHTRCDKKISAMERSNWIKECLNQLQ